jgi:hypothetical protein
MPQTLLAIAAIFCFGLLALGRQRHDNDLTRHTIAMEAELAATDLATARLNRIERLAFDEDDVDHQGIRTQPPTTTLGPDAGETGPDTFDDVDDWSGHDVVEETPVGSGTLRFRTAVSVRYMQNLAPSQPASAPTLTKEIRVTTIEQPETALGRPPAQATLWHVVTPASIGAQTPPTE